MTVEFAYGCLYIGVLIVLAALIGLMVVRAIIGPRITDRILSINVLGTLVISAIAVLSRYLDEGYLLDVALIYTMISFVSVLIMASVYIPAVRRKTRKLRKTKNEKRRGGREDDRLDTVCHNGGAHNRRPSVLYLGGCGVLAV